MFALNCYLNVLSWLAPHADAQTDAEVKREEEIRQKIEAEMDDDYEWDDLIQENIATEICPNPTKMEEALAAALTDCSRSRCGGDTWQETSAGGKAAIRQRRDQDVTISRFVLVRTGGKCLVSNIGA
jgi:hypothetical protein